jgi:hypothetical protein
MLCQSASSTKAVANEGQEKVARLSMLDLVAKMYNDAVQKGNKYVAPNTFQNIKKYLVILPG